AGPARKIRNLQIGTRRVDVVRMRQMMRADKKVAAGNCHVLCQLTFDRKVSLVRIRVFEILFDVQRERQDRTKPREGLIVKALPAKLVLRGCGGARRIKTRGTKRICSRRSADRSLEHLRCIE